MKGFLLSKVPMLVGVAVAAVIYYLLNASVAPIGVYVCMASFAVVLRRQARMYLWNYLPNSTEPEA